jgi:hypothetical protein
MAQTFGVVHILVPGEATKYRLSETTRPMRADHFCRCVRRPNITGHRGQAECVVEFAIGQQSGIGSHHRAAKLKIKRRSKSSRRASDSDSPVGFATAASSIQNKLLIAISESRKPCRNSPRHSANAG